MREGGGREEGGREKGEQKCKYVLHTYENKFPVTLQVPVGSSIVIWPLIIVRVSFLTLVTYSNTLILVATRDLHCVKQNITKDNNNTLTLCMVHNNASRE